MGIWGIVFTISIITCGLVFVPLASVNAAEIQVPATLSEGTFQDWPTFFGTGPIITQIAALTDNNPKTGIFAEFNNQKNTFKVNPNLSDGAPILNVRIEAQMQKGGDFPGATKVRFIVHDDSTGQIFQGSDNFLKKNRETFSLDLPVNPLTGNAWQSSDFSNTIEFGVAQATDNKRSEVLEFRVLFTTIDEPPEITILGPNPLNLLSPTPYVDPGVTASDVPDGDLTSAISVEIFDINNDPVTSIDTSFAGLYTIRYSVTDSAGSTDTKERTVNVVTLNFDSGQYSADGAMATLTVEDFGAVGDGSVSVPVTSENEAGSTIDSLTATLNEISPGIFIGLVELVSADDDSAKLLISPQGKVKATYLSLGPKEATISLAGLSPLAGFGNAPASTDIVRFVESDVYTHAQAATIKVNHAAGTPTVSVQITSTSDSNGISMTLSRDCSTCNSYTSNILLTFSTLSSNQASGAIRVLTGGTVTATYTPPEPDATATITIVDAIGNAPASLDYQPDIAFGRDACASGDADYDGICDAYEDQSAHPGVIRIPQPNGAFYEFTCNPSATLATDPLGTTVCPKLQQKDMYLEIDWMTGHFPSTSAISQVVTAFKNSPVRWAPGQAINGIVLHVFIDNEISHVNELRYTHAIEPSFTGLKLENFGTASERTGSVADIEQRLTAKRQIFHYVMYTHNQFGSTSSGYADRPGNDVVMSLGSFAGKVGSTNQQSGTLMHELGHNLGLFHGGDEDVNCKAPYVSVMNYPHQFPLGEGGFIANRPLDFARVAPSQIVESALREDVNSMNHLGNSLTSVVGGKKSDGTVLGPTTFLTKTRIDWNRDGDVNDGTYGQNTRFFAGIPECSDSSVRSSSQPVKGFVDWNAVQLNFRNLGTFDTGIITIVGNEDSFVSSQGLPDCETASPVVDVADPAAIDEGDLYVPDISITDPHAASWNVEINYGDGDIETFPGLTTSTVIPDHQYTDDGNYDVTVTVTGIDTQCSGEDTTVLTANDVVPTVDAGADGTTKEGTAFESSGSVSNRVDVDGVSLSVDYGDGTGVQALAINVDDTFDLNHVYSQSGTYTVTVRVGDDDGNTDSDTAQVLVTVAYDNLTFESPAPHQSVQQGRTFPVKFTVSEDGSLVPDLITRVYIRDNPGDPLIPGTSNTETENIARYDSSTQRYQFNFNIPNTLSKGPAHIVVQLDDGSSWEVEIRIK